LGKITDMKKFIQNKERGKPENITEGDYLCVIVGVDSEDTPLVLIEQCVTGGSYEHKDRVLLTADMLHVLIEELMAVSEIIDGGTVH
tara:strand:- start:300 stop:560 length:261 start_codon:yes stop_codon:yes gene_type:complete